MIRLVEAEVSRTHEDAAGGVDHPILGVEREVQMRRERCVRVEGLVARAAEQ